VNAFDVQSILSEIDDEFSPKLTSHLDLAAYAEKITRLSTVFSIHERGYCRAFAAVYCNDCERRVAYMTMIAVRKDCRGRGLSNTLLTAVVCHLESIGFLCLQLEVYKSNPRAIAMYGRHAFQVVGETDLSLVLERRL
jgi:ribosomal protein S18 acetylase RimI-like enzyme